jgi:hypothetical protein
MKIIGILLILLGFLIGYMILKMHSDDKVNED